MRSTRIALFLLLTLACGISAAAQSRRVPPAGTGRANSRPPAPSPSPTPKPTAAEIPEETLEEESDVVSVDTRLVTIPVRVMDRKGRFVGGLIREDFKVFEGSVEQEISHFSNEEQPFTLALVLDMSYSAKFKLSDIQAAAIAFIDQLRPNDRIMVISFDEEVRMLCEATNDRREIYRAIRSTAIATGTSLYEAVDMTINDRLRSIEGRKAVVLFTDGVDTTSRRSHDLENLRDATELDAMIYPIRYDTFDDVQAMKSGRVITYPGPPKPRTPPISPTGGTLPTSLPGPVTGTPSDRGTTPEEYARGAEYLQALADRTGGRLYVADTIGNMNAAYSKIASELREFYSLGYYPSAEAEPGRTIRIKVKVDRPNVAVQARTNYITAGRKNKK